MSHALRHPSRAIAAAVTLVVTVGLTALAPPARSAPVARGDDGTPGIKVNREGLPKGLTTISARPRAVGAKPDQGEPGDALPAGVPAKGRYAFLLELTARSTGRAYQGSLSKGKPAAHQAAKSQLSAVTAAQNRVIGNLPDKSRVLYRAHSLLAGVAVVTDVKNYRSLTRLAGVSAVYPISPKTPSNSSAAPLQHAPQAWEAHSNLGEGTTVAVIDTGIDYTHADFGGTGTVEAFNTAKAALGDSPDFPSLKVVDGFDFAGDDYNADPTSPDFNPVPSPDDFPLDCNGHGTHVAGSAVGLGQNGDGTTYAGPYDTTTPFDTMRVGPGIAPHADLVGLRVFGCDGSSDLVSAAIERAADPNGDGDPSDHVDVVNMSLGSDFGSPQDGDSVVTELASAAGISMVVASGNAGDLYDVGGSPGNAPSALAVAASRDSFAQLDALTVSAPGGIADDYAAERSLAFDYANGPDLTGDVVRVEQPGNLDGCDPLNVADAAAVNGHIAFVEWTDDDGARRCGSVGRSTNLAAAGATGFIFADDQETFAGGITGSELIPGVLVAKSGGDAIRAQLMADVTVTIAGTTAAGFTQQIPALDDTIAGFSSRGIGDEGNVKPDVTAVGNTVFSAGSGTGDQGANESGTSMATPMVAGAVALVRTAHPAWTPEQVKANIMNTAGSDIFTGDNQTGDKFAPQRVGSGRIQVDTALDNDVLAYVVDDPGSVSASFGPVAVTEDVTLHKTIRLENTGAAPRTFEPAFDGRTATNGATFSVGSPDPLTVDPGETVDVTLSLHLDASALTKGFDPTMAALQGGNLRQFQSDASGVLVFDSVGAFPDLRVPYYAAPRPASAMTQPASVTMPAGAVQSTLLPLTGQSVSQGAGATRVQSTVAGFGLQAKSGPAPECSDVVLTGCVNFPDEHAADLKHVGATSSAPQFEANGDDPMDASAFFAVSTHGRWRTPASAQEFDVEIDGDADGTTDAIVFNTRLDGTDVMVSAVYDVAADAITWIDVVNDSLGDTDTAIFDSDTMVLQVPVAVIPGVSPGQSRINYAVYSFSPYQADPVDSVGDPEWLSFDVLNPGVALYGSFDGTASPILFPDSPASVLNLRRDATAYAEDGALGAMVVHFHNAIGSKSELVNLKDTPSVGLTLAPNPAARGQQVTATVTVPAGSGGPAAGPVVIKQGATTLAEGAVVNGSAQLTFGLNTAGVVPIHAAYAGDDAHDAGVSAPVNLTVQKTTPTVGLTLSRTTVRPGQKIKAAVTLTTVAGIPATGRVTIRRPNGRILASATLVDGTAKLKWRSKTRRSFTVRAVYGGDANYLGGTSSFIGVKVRR
jgi:subtilisin family serine protease